MAIYHIKVLPEGGFTVQLEMHNGRQKEYSALWKANDVNHLRQQVGNVATLAKETRLARKKNTLAWVSRGGEKT